jgi:cyclic pyranopterin phosphate synthase
MLDSKDHEPLVDGFGRRHSYLRVAVTDRCNLRCTYCMPPGGVDHKPHEEILRFAEIVRVARVLSEMGVDKVRITGGEPLVRRDLPELVASLSALPLVNKVTMTTNGVLLDRYATILRDAGLASVNISLDSLHPGRFASITRRDQYAQVIAGIQAALAAGFEAVKLNVVVMRGVNDDELVDFAELTRDQPLHVRFIEYMPFRDNRWAKDRLVPYTEMRRALEGRYSLLPVLPEDPSQPAREFAIPGHRGRVGIIASMTRPFCDRCSRLRLTADGSLKTCLFHFPEQRLRDALRGGMTDAELASAIRAALLAKPAGHAPMEELRVQPNRIMTEIGG